MAILETIRKRSILLILVIGLSLFAFIISDIIRNRSGINGNRSADIGSVNGETIPSDDFRTMVDNATGGNNQIDVVNYMWNLQVESKLIGKNSKNLGLYIDRSLLGEVVNSSQEYKNYYSNLLNSEGSFDAEKYFSLMNNVHASNPSNYEQWMKQERYVLDQERNKAYKMLVKSGLHNSSVEYKMGYHLLKDKVNLSLVRMSYNKIPDSLISVSDKEISQYVKAHVKEYKQAPFVNMKYVFFEEKASEADETDLKKQLNKFFSQQVEYNSALDKEDTIPSFKDVKNYKDFVNENSDEAFKDKYLFENQLSKKNADSLIKLKKNKLFGPYKEQNYYKLTRKIEAIKLADSVKSAHIIVPFIGSQGADENSRTKKEAKHYIDSIFRLVKNNKTKFKDVADSINTDGTKGKGGDIGWVVYSKIDDLSFDKNFSDYIFFNKVSSIGLVESAFGYHLIRIDQKKSKKKAYKFASITRRIEPSEETVNEIFRKTATFELDVTENKKTFEEATKNTDYKILNSSKVDKMSTSLDQVDTPRPIIQWAFDENTAVGSIKKFNTIRGYIVVKLTKKVPEGVMSVEEARSLVEPKLKKKKKAEKIKKDYSGKTVDELSKTKNWETSVADNLVIKNPTLSSFGREPKVVGYAFALNEGETSNLIDGENGAYMIKITKKEEAPAIENYQSNTNAIFTMSSSDYFFNQSLVKALKEVSDIEDNRILFY